MHLTPAGLPSGIPGIGEDIDKAMQQAPQFSRQIILKGLKAQWRKGATVRWQK